MSDLHHVEQQQGVQMEEVVDLILLMRRQETTTYYRSDYIAGGKNDHIVDGSWRQRIVEWMYGVVDHCSLRRDSVAVAAYYLDLCVEKGILSSRQDFQLAAMTALQLAIKLYDSTVVRLDSMIKLGRGLFNEQDVVDMESKILRALNWQVHPPTPVCFLRQFMRLLPPTVSPSTRYVLAEVTRFIAEISACLHKFVSVPPSIVAYAGMLIAMERIDEVALPVWQREHIFHIMETQAKLDRFCPSIVKTFEELSFSLEKSVSLQDLMDTIDAQCTVQGRNAKTNGSCSTKGLKSPEQGSPREVSGRKLISR